MLGACTGQVLVLECWEPVQGRFWYSNVRSLNRAGFGTGMLGACTGQVLVLEC